MHTFEEIIEFSKLNNNSGFRYLIEYLKEEYKGNRNQRRFGITTYIGTGLSFYCKEWGSPFCAIMDDYKSYCSTSQKKKLKKLYTKENFLQMGDELDCIIKTVDNSFSFNSEFVRVLNEMEHEEFDFSEEKAIFFIPYISFKHVTTNCDDSIEKAYRIMKGTTPQFIRNNLEDLNKVQSVNNYTDLVVHLHGSWDEFESLIMTDTQYNKFYKFENNETALVTFLKRLAQDSHILFLGASLSEKDLAILTMKDELHKSDIRLGEVNMPTSHIAFFKKDDKSADIQDRLRQYGIKVFFTENYEDQSIILREVIREVKNSNWNRQNIFKTNYNISSLKITEIEKLMKSKAGYKVGHITVDQVKDLSTTLWDFLYDKNNRRTYDWRLCLLDDVNNLEFNYIKTIKNPVNYNYPLGNTIYIIFKNKISNSKGDECIANIYKWFHGDNGKRKFDNGLKIRIIEVIESSFNNTKNSKKNKLPSNIRQALSTVNTKDELLEVIKKIFPSLLDYYEDILKQEAENPKNDLSKYSEKQKTKILKGDEHW